MKGWPGEPDMEYDVLMAQGEAAVNAGKPITDVIFDFGNVLLYWEPSAVLIPRYSAETIEQFLDNDISGFYDANDRVDAGATPEEKPAEDVSAIEQVKDTTAALESAEVKTHTVKEGEDMVSIAILYSISPSTIMDLNDLKANDTLTPGQVLKLPANAKMQ